MKVLERLCVQNWFIDAANGDRLDLVRGKEYTTTPYVIDGEVTVFSRFWVKAPVSIFHEQQDVSETRPPV
jgi:hypothetical protein